MPPVSKRFIGITVVISVLAAFSALTVFYVPVTGWLVSASTNRNWMYQARSVQSMATTSPVEVPGDPIDRMPVEQRLSIRRETIRTACQRVKPPLTAREKMIMYGDLVVDDEHRTIWCPVRKSGTTSWRVVMLILNGKFSSVSVALDHVMHHDFQYITRMRHKYRNRADVEYRVKNYTKFMSYREPLGRVVSDYRQIRMGDTAFREKICKAIVAYSSKSSMNKGQNTGKAETNAWKNISFPHFVNYVTRFHGNRGKSLDLNGHWKPTNLVCHPCHIDYDYYIDLERPTVTDDTSFLLKVLAAPQWLKLPKENPSRKETKYSFLSQLSATQFQRLLSLYDTDYEIFNYQRPNQNG